MSYRCSECYRSFEFQENLKTHFANKHREVELSSSESESGNLEGLVDNQIRYYLFESEPESDLSDSEFESSESSESVEIIIKRNRSTRNKRIIPNFNDEDKIDLQLAYQEVKSKPRIFRYTSMCTPSNHKLLTKAWEYFRDPNNQKDQRVKKLLGKYD